MYILNCIQNHAINRIIIKVNMYSMYKNTYCLSTDKCRARVIALSSLWQRGKGDGSISKLRNALYAKTYTKN